MNAETIARLKSLLGPKGFIEDPAEIAPHLEEWRGKYHGRSALMLKPASTAEVSAILKICHETGTAVVPQGGNTGLVGGQLPFDGEILLDLSRLRAIRALDKNGASIVAEAGVILAEAQKAADDAGLMLPLSMASEGSATIGGFLSTNAGGVNVLRYGMAREQTLGLEVVLADGTVLDLLRTLRKDNTGYDLKQLFIGAEGTLGIVTAAALKLSPLPSRRFTALLAVPNVSMALLMLHRIQFATVNNVTAFELMPHYGMELVTKHIPGAETPFDAPSPWYVLCEVSGDASIEKPFGQVLALSLEDDYITNGAIATSEAQRTELWRLRECMSEAEKLEGPSFKHDIAVPVSAQAEFIEKAVAAMAAFEPRIKPIVFGHLGDGNLHFNFMLPPGGEDLLDRWDEIAAAVYKVVREFRGTISAEHGIGVMKRAELAKSKSPEEIALMRLLKHTLDPKNILNPGKLLPDG
jgi:FAD/FMN-containing dehydrogenase